MSTFNLIRNSKVFFTTNVSATTGLIDLGASHTSANTFELQVLDGFSFNQATNADTITLSEAGATPVRGQRSFNTSLSNVEFSFSTYMRPAYASSNVKAEESVLWNALLSADAIGTGSEINLATPSAITVTAPTSAVPGKILVTTSAASTTTMPVGTIFNVKGVLGAGASRLNTAVKVSAVTASTSVELTYMNAPLAATLTTGNANVTTAASWASAKLSKAAWNANAAVAADASPGIPTAYASINTALSNKNKLQAFGLIIIVDSATYFIENCAMDQAVVDFGLDGIAMVAWTGKGIKLTSLTDANTITASAGTFTGASLNGTTGAYLEKNTTAGFITNKLSTISLTSGIGGTGTAYSLALTGGSVTIANNITYVTPANLGIVNLPIGYFTGTRAITGSLTAYLRTGTAGTADLLRTLLAGSSTDTDPEFKVQVDIGGTTNTTRVEFEVPAAMVQIPTIDSAAVMSTTITFTGQGYDNRLIASSVYDIEDASEATIRYFAPAA